MTHKVSIIIPTYNRASLLPRAVESAQAAGTDVKVIVVDNASSDKTAEICSNLAEVKYIRLNRNLGEGGARNVGITESRSEFVAFLDDDDLRLPGSLDKQIDVLEREPDAALVYGPVMFGHHDDCRPTGDGYPKTFPTGDVFWELLKINFIPMPSVVARKQHLIEAGLFETGLKLVRDWDLWLRVTAQFPVAAVREPVAIYRQWDASANQISADRAAMYHAAAAVHARGLRLPKAQGASRATRRQVRRKFLNSTSDSLLYEAVTALIEGRTGTACRNLAMALRLQPFRLMRREHLRGLFYNALKDVHR